MASGSDFKIGDHVELSHSSHTMVVVGIREDDVECVWHNERGTAQREWYPRLALKRFAARYPEAKPER